MKGILAGLLVLAPVIFALANETRYAIPKGNEMSVYENRIRKVYEQPVFTVGVDERVRVLEVAGDRVRVEGRSGRSGWADRSALAFTSGKTLGFEGTLVEGFSDKILTAIIIDVGKPGWESIKLDRSFADALRENIDREEVERVVAGK